VRLNLRHLQRSLIWSTSGTCWMPYYGMQWPGSEAVPAPLITLTPHPSPFQSRWADWASRDTGRLHLAPTPQHQADDVTLAPVVTPDAVPVRDQLTNQHQRCGRSLPGTRRRCCSRLPQSRQRPPSSTPRWAESRSPSPCLTDFEVAAALQLRTLVGEREAHCTRCGEANFFGQP
jgi:hypothetical protein